MQKLLAVLLSCLLTFSVMGGFALAESLDPESSDSSNTVPNQNNTTVVQSVYSENNASIEIEIKEDKVEIKGSDFKLEIKADKVEFKSNNGKLEITNDKVELKGNVLGDFKQKLQEYDALIEKGVNEKIRLRIAETIAQLEEKSTSTQEDINLIEIKDVKIDMKDGKVEIKGPDFILEIKKDKIEFKSDGGKLEITNDKVEIKGNALKDFKQKIQEYNALIEKGVNEDTQLWIDEVVVQLEEKVAAIEAQKKLLFEERELREEHFKKLGQLYKAIGNVEIKAFVNGQIPTFDVPPVIKDGRTIVPLRAIAEALGATVGYDQETRTISIVRGENTITLKLEDTQAEVNGQVVNLDVPAQVENGRTMVPVRFISEGFGAQVNYEPVGNIAIIEAN